ncbi:MAG: glycosyltransferase family 2 protein [Clostridiales bacterium]|nr:glycosyltransferase family 2 protein [Clostridiales bacterium]
MLTHTYAICAYKESPYLETCIRSLKRQSVQSEIILCTSTPNDHIRLLVEKYRIPLYVREGKSEIGADWNFAYETAQTDLVTIAHQDDSYHKDYGKYLLRNATCYPDMTVFMTDCGILRGSRPGSSGIAGGIKRMLRFPLRLKSLANQTLVKRAVLCLGNPVICPSCTYHKGLLGTPLFTSRYRFVLDWDTMWGLALRPGRFICEERQLLRYRIHEDSATKKCMDSNRRFDEEMAMFQKIWPRSVSRFLMFFYRFAARAYR